MPSVVCPQCESVRLCNMLLGHDMRLGGMLSDGSVKLHMLTTTATESSQCAVSAVAWQLSVVPCMSRRLPDNLGCAPASGVLRAYARHAADHARAVLCCHGPNEIWAEHAGRALTTSCQMASTCCPAWLPESNCACTSSGASCCTLSLYHRMKPSNVRSAAGGGSPDWLPPPFDCTSLWCSAGWSLSLPSCWDPQHNSFTLRYG